MGTETAGRSLLRGQRQQDSHCCRDRDGRTVTAVGMGTTRRITVVGTGGRSRCGDRDNRMVTVLGMGTAGRSMLWGWGQQEGHCCKDGDGRTVTAFHLENERQDKRISCSPGRVLYQPEISKKRIRQMPKVKTAGIVFVT